MNPISPENLISKAERAIASAKLLHEAGDVDGVCNRAYYAMFDAAKAALLKSVPGIDPTVGKTHSGLISAFGLHLVKTGLVPVEVGRTFNRAHDIRQAADYTGDMIEPADVNQLLQDAENFVALVKVNFVSKPVVVSTGMFFGSIKNVTGNIVTQNVSRDGQTVAHDLKALSRTVKSGEIVDIKYVNGVGIVGGKEPKSGVEI